MATLATPPDIQTVLGNSKEAALPTEGPYKELADFLAHGGGEPEAIITFRPSREAHERFYTLMDKEKDNQISEAETHELNQCMEFEHFLRMAKIRARLLIQERTKADTKMG